MDRCGGRPGCMNRSLSLTVSVPDGAGELDGVPSTESQTPACTWLCHEWHFCRYICTFPGGRRSKRALDEIDACEVCPAPGPCHGPLTRIDFPRIACRRKGFAHRGRPSPSENRGLPGPIQGRHFYKSWGRLLLSESIPESSRAVCRRSE
jgi:hypothetical protein